MAVVKILLICNFSFWECIVILTLESYNEKTMKYKDALAFARVLRKNQTYAEKVFWFQVRNRKLFGKKFKRQFIVEHADVLDEKYFYIVDFYCHEHLLVVELDGKIHLQQREYDQHRERRLKEMGLRVVRFENEEVVNDWEGVREKLREVLGC